MIAPNSRYIILYFNIILIHNLTLTYVEMNDKKITFQYLKSFVKVDKDLNNLKTFTAVQEI